MNTALTVSEAAARFGLSAHTLRWYEQVGLVGPVPRDGAGRRRYAEADLNRLAFLTRLRTTGMPVREMLRYVELARSGPQTAPARRALLEEHRRRVLARIADLQADLEVINVKIDSYGSWGVRHRIRCRTPQDPSRSDRLSTGDGGGGSE